MEKFKIGLLNEDNIKIPKKDFKKMMFINNAIENGWTVKKRQSNYIFSKKHENKVEVYDKNYLENFIENSIKSS
jgi:hypothetical protein